MKTENILRKSTIILLISFFFNNVYPQTDSIQSMVLIPGGEFIMGKGPSSPADFSPAHKVNVDSFYMDMHEVTNAEYMKFCMETKHNFPEFWNVDIFRCGEKYPNHPVVGVNWYDTQKYAQWAGKRLPTEAEWEYAARGSLIDNDFPNGNKWDIPLRRNKTGEWENQIVETSSFEANGYGLYDMGGNVWEWTSDVYDSFYYNESPSDNPKGPKTGTCRVIRGGSWHSGKMCHKVFFRKGLTANWKDFAVGFRCVKDIK